MLYGDAGNDDIRGGEDADTGYGGDGDDFLVAERGADRLYGDAGNDDLYGGTGSDSLYGGAGNDGLYGADGADRLQGGIGRDRMDGWNGADVFVFSSLSELGLGGNADRINNFFAEEGDLIDLVALNLTFIGSAAFTAAMQVRFVPTAEALQINTDADAAAEYYIYLTDITDLSASSILT